MRQLSYTIEPEADGLSVNAYARNIAGLSGFYVSVKFENGILINGQRVTTRVCFMPGTPLFLICPMTASVCSQARYLHFQKQWIQAPQQAQPFECGHWAY